MGDEKEILNVVNGSSTSKDEPFKLFCHSKTHQFSGIGKGNLGLSV